MTDITTEFVAFFAVIVVVSSLVGLLCYKMGFVRGQTTAYLDAADKFREMKDKAFK